jgi:hypothetical protein
VAGYLGDHFGTSGLAALLGVPMVVNAVPYLTLTRTRPAPTVRWAGG